MYMKNNGTYFNLNKRIFYTTVYSSFVPLIKGNIQQLFFELDMTIIFHWLVSNDKDNRDYTYLKQCRARLEIIWTNNN
jgi:hypothetical protein